MKKNLSTTTMVVPGLTVRGLNSPQNNKKVQGFDKAATLQSFNSKIQKIKNRPKNQSLQDAYVKGLQDEIHYLQLELKLLKQKQIAKHSQVDQLETFFGDGIPINENILALKNGFNSYKTQIEKKISDLELQKKERQNIIQSLSVKVSQISKQIHDNQKVYKQSLTSKSDITHEKIKKQSIIKQQIESQDECLRTLKSENRRMIQNVGSLQRAKELLLVAMMKIQNNKFNKLNKIRESVAEKEKEFQQLGKNYEELKKQEQQKSYVIRVQQDNIKLKKRIISLQKQLNSLNIKAEEKKMELDAKLKQRHKQILARMDMQSRLDSIKQSIDIENNMNVQELEKIANEKTAKILEKIIDKNRKLSKYIQYYGNLLAKVDESLYEFGEKKPDLKTKLSFHQNQIKVMQKQLQRQKLRQFQLVSEIAKLSSKSSHISEIVPPAIEDIKKEQDKIKAAKVERQRLIQEIKLKQKQLQLMEIVKGLSLEETEISSTSNASIRDRLVDFMRNWQSLSRQQQ